MELLEYQAKELFHQLGIPVLPSQRIEHPKDLKGLGIPYPVVLKSQVHAGGRGKAGGIRFAENTIDAIAAAQAIFNLPIRGQYPEVVLAEAKYDADREFYLAVVLDRSCQRPLLLGSQSGGIEVEATLEQMQKVVVDQEFSPFYARRLALQMGLQGNLILSVSSVVEKMYGLFMQKDLDLIEINPLAVGPTGELMALDGKVTANDEALNRHPDLIRLIAHIPGRDQGRAPATTVAGLELVELEGGNIGVLCSGAGLTMTTLDLIHQKGGKPGNFINLGGEHHFNYSLEQIQERIKQGLDLICHSKGIKVVLINLIGNAIACDLIASVITNYLQRQTNGHRLPQLIVRLAGNAVDQAQETLAKLDIPVINHLDDAIAEAVAATKAK